MKEEMRSHAVICGHLMRKATVRRENAFCERNMQKSRSTRSTCPQAVGAMPEKARKIRQFCPLPFPETPCGAPANLSATCPHFAKPVRSAVGGRGKARLPRYLRQVQGFEFKVQGQQQQQIQG